MLFYYLLGLSSVIAGIYLTISEFSEAVDYIVGAVLLLMGVVILMITLVVSMYCKAGTF